MTYVNAVKYLKSVAKNNSRGDLLRLWARIGAPYKRMKYIRLAGSNGKTVCAEMLTSVLSRAGYTVGCLRMPMRAEPKDNICICGKTISMDEFSQYVADTRAALKATEAEGEALLITAEELLLTVAVLAFTAKKCDLCIIESDHFGDDPSTCLHSPLAAVICGTIPNDDKGEIAKIRSYIRKGIQEIVSAPQDREAYRIISETCYSINCRLTLPNRTAVEITKRSLRGTEFSYKNRAYSLRLCGSFQVSNAVLVIEAAQMLSRKGFPISEDSVVRGLSSVTIPAKFEVISLKPLIIVDSTHTPVAIEAVCDSMAEFKEISGTNVRLCLPDADLTDGYADALEKRGYNIEKAILPQLHGQGLSESLPFPVELEKTSAAIVSKSLDALGNDTMLLISGYPAFVNEIRYKLLAKLGY